jgi:hypothetical protein
VIVRSRGPQRKRAITPATLLMAVIAVSFLVVLIGTRFGLDIVGPHLVNFIESLHEQTGWYEGAREADSWRR